ncbi:two-component sensor histidine kinase [Bacteroidales bacterium]|nr:two-component sensor histidine kinase [Bacteroidales bacterium]
MRKSTVWLLTGVMIFAFIGLLYLQINYVQIILRTQKASFEERIKRSLYQVARNLELDEVEDYLRVEMIGDKFLKGSNKIDFGYGKTFAVDRLLDTEIVLQIDTSASTAQIRERDLAISHSYGKRNTLVAQSKLIQESTQGKYIYIDKLVREVIRKIMYNGSLKPIEERVSFNKLDKYLRVELENADITLAYCFALVDKDRKIVFACPDYNKEAASDLYTQLLFPRDAAGKFYTLQVYFPDQRNYLLNTVTFIAPSVGFTIVLLVIFVFTIYIVFRQKRLSEMKTDFINNMTHELKTPVSTISLASQMLYDQQMMDKSPETLKHISGIIHDEAKRLSFLVEKVLQISLFEGRKIMLKIKEIDANDLLASVANTFALRVEKDGGRLDVDLQALDSLMYVDRMHFTNVLFNLMENAVKYKQPEIPLVLIARTYNDGGRLLISIQDNGIGIKKENYKKVFDRFYRVGTGNRHDVKGFGLGLAYVKKMVEMHSGIIKVESELGVGTKFIIIFPTIK